MKRHGCKAAEAHLMRCRPPPGPDGKCANASGRIHGAARCGGGSRGRVVEPGLGGAPFEDRTFRYREPEGARAVQSAGMRPAGDRAAERVPGRMRDVTWRIATGAAYQRVPVAFAKRPETRLKGMDEADASEGEYRASRLNEGANLAVRSCNATVSRNWDDRLAPADKD